MKRHTRTAAALASATLMAVAAAGCSDSGSGGSSSGTDTGSQNSGRQVDVAAASTSPSPSKSPAPTVSLRKGAYGKILVNAKKMTLYVFDKDTKNKSACTGACAKAWPPLLDTKAPTAGSGVDTKLLKTTTRSDGKKQVTYNGHPLYLFDEDQKAGDIKGQGVDAFGAKWYVINAKGKQVTTKPTATPTATPTAKPTATPSSSTGNGY
ncbi:hypothetical protein [Streptomyces sp. NPDC059814]|uniref:COG4315 family predicted lipoprotein n=1 Tax=Streptomyces sp. NPDC059814 TaxID=3346959 RepID=UPI00364DB389